MIKKGNKIRPSAELGPAQLLMPIGFGVGGWAALKQLRAYARKAKEQEEVGPTPSKYPTVPTPQAPTGVDLPSPKQQI